MQGSACLPALPLPVSSPPQFPARQRPAPHTSALTSRLLLHQAEILRLPLAVKASHGLPRQLGIKGHGGCACWRRAGTSGRGPRRQQPAGTMRDHECLATDVQLNPVGWNAGLLRCQGHACFGSRRCVFMVVLLCSPGRHIPWRRGRCLSCGWRPRARLRPGRGPQARARRQLGVGRRWPRAGARRRWPGPGAWPRRWRWRAGWSRRQLPYSQACRVTLAIHANCGHTAPRPVSRCCGTEVAPGGKAEVGAPLEGHSLEAAGAPLHVHA
jgi:hypothetical protein